MPRAESLPTQPIRRSTTEAARRADRVLDHARAFRHDTAQARAESILAGIQRQRAYDARLFADERLLRTSRQSDQRRAGALDRLVALHDRVASAALGENPTTTPPMTEASHETTGAADHAVTYRETA